MKIIGLCGGSGAGKTQICNIFAKYQIPSVNTDDVSKIVMCRPHKCYLEVVQAFGEEILDNNREIIRKKLAQIIYSDIEKKKQLEKITHKHIIEHTMQTIAELQEQGYEYVIVDAPLLFESGMDKMCYKTVAVISEEENRIKRIMQRDGISREFAIDRIKAQLSSQELKERCDYLLGNDSDLIQLEETVRKMVDEIKK